MIHELKIKPEYFAAVVSGDKTFEIRNNADRNFQVGDTLLLWEWDGGFTGQTVERVVSYITDFEQKPGYVVLGLANKREQELAEQLADATRQCGVMAELLRESHEVMRRIIPPLPQDCANRSDLLDRVEVALAGKMPTQHPDDAAVDRFAVAMKVKLSAARSNGRGGWDDPSACSVEFLADLLVNHLGKGNQGNFEDIANLAMMLHQRGADPTVLAHAVTLTTCSRCKGHGMIGGVTGQTPESMDFWEAECPDCDGRGKVKVKGRAITEGQELELVTVLQSIVNGFSDDPAHDAAALLKRVTGEVPWTGDSFQLPPRQGGEQIVKCPHCNAEHQDGRDAAEFIGWHGLCATCELKGGEPCAFEPPSSSPA
ncbi:DUF3850 domain-containing protein [Aeromonas sobria]|uniref:DUF3850 domain-containing protein n=1 Tax=Aeromonas sobria TaxID=646 RepID=UPI0019621B40|nr:DUF3850 domain-containing protein [Aeromonas sobria]